MADSTDLMRKLREATGPRPDRLPEADEEECAAFGYLRGVRERAAHVEFRLADGGRLALPYSWLGACLFEPSSGVLLGFAGDLNYLVLVQGSNLNRPPPAVGFYERLLLRHRVTFVREMTTPEIDRAAEGEVTVDRILRAA